MPPDQLHAAFVADARSSRNVVDRVAAQRHYVDDFVWRDAERLSHLVGVENQIILLRIENFHVRRDQLHHVFVAGDDKTSCCCSAASRANVPITSSASKPSASRMGMRSASSARRI